MNIQAAGVLLATVFAFSAQTPQTALTTEDFATTPVRHLEYRFAYGTPIADSGPGTGTMSVDILGTAPDGGTMISGTDEWWNALYPRESSQCEIYPDGGVTCPIRPYNISEAQLILFPMLARDYFKGVQSASGSWSTAYDIQFGPTDLFSAKSEVQLNETGVVDNRIANVDVSSNIAQTGGRFTKSTLQAKVAYDLVGKVPVAFVSRQTRIPNGSVFNSNVVSVQLMKDSLAKN